MKPHLHVFNRNEGAGPWWKTAQWSFGATVRGRYFGRIAKGWWKLGRSEITNYLELELAAGGEDGMVQAGVVLPFVGRGSIGVGVPRSWLKGWIYHRREWTLRVGYVGRWLEVLVASDEDMRDTGMVSYYRRQLDNGTYDGPWSRAALWPGWHFTFAPKPLDRLLGRKECTTVKGEPQPVIVPMPEGNYPGRAIREERVWKRKRWPWPSAKRADYWIEMDIGVPVPGKGENSWDIDDDAVFGTGGRTVPEAVANVTRSALRQRERYAGPDWRPADGWPEGVGGRA